MSNKDFHIKLQLRIDWSELDYFGHVNNVSFFKYIQAARVNYWDTIGLTKSHKKTNIGPILASSKCDFIKPLFFPGQITILSRVDFVKNTSFCICHRLINDKVETVGEAQDIIVLFDFNKNEKVSISKELKTKIENIENGLG